MFSRISRVLSHPKEVESPKALRNIELVNAVLSALGREQITKSRYDGLVEELKSDTNLAKAYSIAAPIFRKNSPHKAYRLGNDWHQRIDRAPSLVDLFYVIPRAVKPHCILETGVAYGNTSSVLVAAMAHNDCGQVISIDLPRTAEMKDFPITDSETGMLVPDSYRDRWNLMLGDTFDLLQNAFNEYKPDMFVHDSYHAFHHMMFEYALAERYLPRPSIIISDDITVNPAFSLFTKHIGARAWSHADNINVGVCVLNPSL